MTSIKPFFLPVTLLIFILTLTNIVVSSSYTTTGEKLKTLEQQKQQLSEHNRVLQQHILSFSSLGYLQKQAQTEGFIPPESAFSLSYPSVTVALSE